MAVGLAWIFEPRTVERDNRRGTEVAKLDGVRAFLEQQDKRRLIEMILGEALDNERFCERLLEVAGTNPSARQPNNSALRG